MRANAKKVQAKRAVCIEQVEAPKVSLEEALGGFLEYKEKQGLAEKTRQCIKDTVKQYYKWMECAFGEEKDFGRFLKLRKTRTPGTQFDGVIEEGTIEPSTRNQRVVWCKAFWDWCIGQNYLKSNPGEGYSTTKTNRIPDAPSADAVGAVVRSLYDNAMKEDARWNVVRNACITMIQLASGSRAGDLLGVRASDVIRRVFDGKPRYSLLIRAEDEKSGKTRVLTGLDSREVVKLLDKLLQMWHLYTNTDKNGKPLPETDGIDYWAVNAPLFCSQDGTRLKNASPISKAVKTTASKLGVKDEWNNRQSGGVTGVHDIRRFFATQYVTSQYEQGQPADIMLLGAMLGHSDLNTTKKYVDAITTQKKLEETPSAVLPIGCIFPSGTPNAGREKVRRAPRKAGTHSLQAV